MNTIKNFFQQKEHVRIFITSLLITFVLSFTIYSVYFYEEPAKIPQKLELPALAYKAVSSTVIILVQEETYYTVGTGFVITKDRLIATNAHVILDEIYQPSELSKIKVVSNLYTEYTVNKLYIDIDNDLALLTVDNNTLPYLETDVNTTPLLGEEILSVGHPQHIYFSVSQGIISQTNVDLNNNLSKFTGKSLSGLKITSIVSPGTSGGPILNRYGYLVGVNVSYDHDNSLFFAIPASTLNKFIKNKKNYEVLDQNLPITPLND